MLHSNLRAAVAAAGVAAAATTTTTTTKKKKQIEIISVENILVTCCTVKGKFERNELG